MKRAQLLLKFNQLHLICRAQEHKWFHHLRQAGTGLGQMGARKNPSTVLDGLYGVQLGLPSQPAQSVDEALRTTVVVESSTCEHQKHKGGSGTTQQRLMIR